MKLSIASSSAGKDAPDLDHRFSSGARLLMSTQGEGGTAGATGVASVQLWVAAGTCAEGPEEHGCAHLLEHMVFKPHPRRGEPDGEPEDLATAVERVGGDVNAYTSYDETVYHATVPVERARAAIEAVLGAALDPAFDSDELAKEREVVVEEILQYDDDPASASMDHLIEDIFRGHDYGRPILGRAAEVRSHDAKKLAKFHRRNYAGSRLTLVIVGAVDEDLALRAASPYLDAVPRRRSIVPEALPAMGGRPSVKVSAEDVSEVHVRLGWMGPGARDEAAVALDLAATALGHGESSPLASHVRRELSLVSDAHASFLPFAHRGVFLVSAQTIPDRVDAATEAVFDQVVRMTRVPLEQDAFERARAQLRSALVYRRETVQGRAHALGFFSTVCGSVEAEAAYYAALERLEPVDVMRIMHRVIAEGRPVLHVIVPEQSDIASAEARRGLRTRLGRALRAPWKRKGRKFDVDARGVHVTELAGGLRLCVLPDTRVPIVGGLMVWPGGLRSEAPRLAGATNLASGLLTRGTTRRDGESLAREIDGMAAVIEGFAGRNSVGLQFESLAQHSPTVIRRALECAALPKFSTREFEEERRVTLEELAADEDDMGHVVFRAMLAELYGKHPYGRSVRGTTTSLPTLTPEIVRRLWSREYPLGDAAICLAGDVDPQAVADLVSVALEDDLGGERGRLERPESGGRSRRAEDRNWPGRAPKPRSRARVSILERRRAQAHVAVGFPGLRMGEPRQAALDVLTTILGGQSGRLFVQLRERDGLVYHAGASSTEGIDAGHVSIYAATAQDKLERTMDAIWSEIASLRDALTTEAEFERARAWLIGNHNQGLQRRSRLAAHLAFAEAYDLGRGYFFEVPTRLARVTRKDVRALANELLDRRRSVTTIIRSPSS